jgi:hypothetical protein
MKKVSKKQDTPIQTGLRALIFGIGKEDGMKIIHRLGYTLLNEHEKLFGSYLLNTFGPPSSFLGEGISVSVSQSP